ncbi:MAG: hypothetical protein N838_23935 [Thiohalocapsa sp. PB-PSB1]|nr:MAG: hypothetical protein N838_23935 [Thiohalocapsa sp. PB-PSB1]
MSKLVCGRPRPAAVGSNLAISVEQQTTWLVFWPGIDVATTRL